MNDEFIRKLEEKHRSGEISRETYEDILQRYQQEVEQTGAKEKNETTAEYLDKAVQNAIKEEEESGKKDYKCAGSCTIPPGKYGYISGAGSVSITGDVKAIKLSVAGSLHAKGYIKVESFKSAGSAKIEGDIIAENVSAAGILNARNLNGEKVRIGGALVCDKIIGENVSIGGSVKAKMLKGEEIKIKLDGKSEVDEIKGEKIEIKSKRGIIRRFSGHLKSKKITGENIYIESTTADLVDGENVIVGERCNIGVVKGEKIKISEKSTVGKVIRK